eukprot:UN10730
MYTSIFTATCGVAAVLYYFTQYKDKSSNSTTTTEKELQNIKTPEFILFQRTWLAVYLLAMFSDWLQGPYAYALYNSLNFTKSEIALLSVTGFGSSMLVGTFAGSLSDSFGLRSE